MKEKRKSSKTLSLDEEKQLLNWTRQNHGFRDYVVILTILRTGIRIKELRELFVSDISVDGEILTHLKVRAEIAHDKKAREIPIPNDLREQLKAFLDWKQENGESIKPTSFLFSSAKSSQISIRHLQRIVRESTQDALGMPHSVNVLRRTYQARHKTEPETTFSDVTSANDSIQPILARLSFWMPPERMTEFEAVYQKKVMPILKRHGLAESSECGRTTVEGVFSRLFEVETLSQVKEKDEELRYDQTWQELLRALGETFGTTETEGRIQHRFGLYVTPSGPGTVISAGRGRGHWQTYDSTDGLPDNWVYSIFQDRDGNLWFGTVSGVGRYDGQNWTTFTTKDGLPYITVFSIFQDEEGNFWFGTRGGGVSRYDGQTWTTFTTKDGLAHNSVFSIIQTRDGVLWFGTDGGGVSRYDGQKWATLTTDDGLPSNSVWAIFQDREDYLWFGTDGGVSRYDGQIWTTFTKKDGLSDNAVRWIFQDEDGNFWFGTHVGLSRYDGQEFTTFTTKDGLASNEMMKSILQDRHGALWIPAGGGGVSRYDGQTMTTFTTTDGLAHDSVRLILQDEDGNLWFGTWGGGISWYDGKTFTNFTTDDGLSGNTVRSMILDRNGCLWVGTYHGNLSRYDGRTWATFTSEDGFLGHPIFSIMEDIDGYIWIGTREGLSRYDGKTFTTFTTEDGLAHNEVRSILQDRDGNLWFGTWDGGVSRYDGQTWTTFTTKDGLGENRIQENYGIFQDRDGNLWFGTRSGGVSRYDGETWTTFTTDDGLPSNSVWAILQDREGYLWFGTDGGAVQYDGQVFQTLTQQDGLASNHLLSILEARNGDIWIGTINGVTRYRRPAPSPPGVSISAVLADRRYEDVSEVAISESVGLVVFEFHGRSFRSRQEAMVYRYRLNGFDTLRTQPKGYHEDWKNTKARRAEYHNLPQGNYTFEVQAVDQDLVYSEPATVTVTVEPDPQITALQAEVDHLRREVSSKYHFENIVGRSAAIKEVRALMEKAVDSGLTVLITGETGTGKELVAKAIHYNSSRKNKPWREINCGAVPKEMVASTLFGHCKGAFTDAHEDKPGLFEEASGGTVLLDEIADMPESAQVNLLRVLQERKVQRLGEFELRDVDVRVIAVTNRDLSEEVSAGRFRQDLYYRLSVFLIYLPPLRERPDDIPLLAEHFLQQACHQQNKEIDDFAPDVMDMLTSYSWPGNVRELENGIARAVALAEESWQIQTYHFPSQITGGESLIQDILSEQAGLSTAVKHLKRRMVEDALRKCGGNRTQAAQMLGTHRSSLIRLMNRLDID